MDNTQKTPANPSHHAPTTGARRAAWRILQREGRRIEGTSLRSLLDNPDRPAQLRLEAAGLVADFSKQRIDGAVIDALIGVANSARLPEARQFMLGGGIANPTEGRQVLHTALRGNDADATAGQLARAERERIRALATRFRNDELRGHTGQPLETLVCIGIGGSDLGPRLVCDALATPDAPDVRFVANVDPADLARNVAGLDPATTAFLVVSKTFTTRETLANAEAALNWLTQGGVPREAALKQFIGVTANPEAAEQYGVPSSQILRFWDWVGGRYSLWSAAGVSIAIACGPDAFEQLLDGAHAMDEHFQSAPFKSNLPAWLGMISIWNRDILDCATQAIIPYSERLRLLPNYLQQLIMESNGKSARVNGSHLSLPSAPVIWGVSGTNAQHSFFQQLHQGPDTVPVDFILARKPDPATLSGADDPRHQILVANCLAQSAALALGKPLPNEAQGEDWHKAFPGNRPSTLILLPSIDARSLGALLAAYEHATFVASVILGINAFDQFGVEYGKVMAKSVETALAGGDASALDPATRALLGYFRG
ncbi:glucose-6-phosphate isomerase [Lautropia dentalis]|uniref:Glucose-6-phosphate isomerase n=1 Tax=Lautropia dentalis TaxID=2490857 RepID=A0A426FQU5_9BURK|nr:glucose-6-phosphate isomerase [Lautropia dentalis]RRN45072.1 glucose-6-phosphate isomerase [Lautropia dentalis]